MTVPTVVVANHDAIYLQMIQDVLTDVGYPRVICVTGDEAFMTVKREQPGVALIDINIKDPDRGWNLINMLRLAPPRARFALLFARPMPISPQRVSLDKGR